MQSLTQDGAIARYAPSIASSGSELAKDLFLILKPYVTPSPEVIEELDSLRLAAGRARAAGQRPTPEEPKRGAMGGPFLIQVSRVSCRCTRLCAQVL